jgi:hypothetical protein
MHVRNVNSRVIFTCNEMWQTGMYFNVRPIFSSPFRKTRWQPYLRGNSNILSWFRRIKQADFGGMSWMTHATIKARDMCIDHIWAYNNINAKWGRCSCNVLGLYSEGARLESRPGHRLSCLRSSWFYRAPTGERQDTVLNKPRSLPVNSPTISPSHTK